MVTHGKVSEFYRSMQWKRKKTFLEKLSCKNIRINWFSVFLEKNMIKYAKKNLENILHLLLFDRY